MTRSTVAELLDFWFADSAESPAAARRRHDFWYRANTATDREIRRRFGHLIEAARRGELQHWVSDAEGSLALVIVLDQFTRNVHRSTPLAYYGDALALDVAEHAVATGQLRGLPPTGAVFLLHPYHHSEQLALQDRGLRLLRQLIPLSTDVWQPYLHRSVDGFTKHRDIVARFGRFPHRNRVLGRQNTPAEQAFLEEGAATFGQ